MSNQGEVLVEQREHFDYRVESGESVVVEIEPEGVGNLAEAAQNGQPLAGQAVGGVQVFEFQIDEPLHLLRVAYHFPPGTGVNARYTVRVSGSAGGAFDDQPISNRGQTDVGALRKFTYEFWTS